MGTWKAKTALAVTVLLGLTVGTSLLTTGAGARDEPAVSKAEEPKPAAKAEGKDVVVTGTVVGPDGKPVAGAVLRTPETMDLRNAIPAKAPVKPPAVEVAKTGADGKFAVTVKPLPAGTPDYRQLVATKPGFGPAWIDVRDATDAPVTLQLVADDVPVKGRITDLEGKPVAKAKVELKSVAAGDLAKVWEQWPSRPESALRHLKEAWAGLTGLPTSVTTDADGKFEIAGVGRGRILAFTVEAPGIETASCRAVTDAKFDPKSVQLPSHETMRRGSFQPGPALYGPTFTHTAKPSQPVVGVVTDAKTGKPIAGVQVNGDPDAPHWYENGGCAFTDADGKFTLHGLAKADRVRLVVFPTSEQPFFLYSTTVAGKPGLTEIPAELKLTRGVVVKGRVIEKGSGKPVAGAGIRYAALADNKFYAELMNGKRSESGMAWNSDAEGRFQFVALPGAGIVLAQGETRGRDTGTEFTQVRIAKTDLPRADLRNLERLGEAFSAADAHIVTLYGLSGYAIIEPKLTDDSVEVEIVFDRGKTVNGKVLGADGKPATGVTAYELTACYDQAVKVKDGTFTAIALDPDHPRTLLFVDEATKLSATVALKGDEKGLTLKLEPWGKLTGRLLDADGKPLVGASVRVYPKNSFQHIAFRSLLHNFKPTTDNDGRFALEVPAGPVEYVVSFSLKNKYIDVGRRPNDPGHVVKPGMATDVGEARAKAE